MFARCCVRGLLLLCLGSFGSTLIGCNNTGLNSVAVTPASQSLAVGQTVQFTAVGTYGNAKNLTTQNITSSVTWASSVPSVATVSASGIATAVGAGTTTITASASGWSGHVSSSAILAVTGSSGGGGGGGGGSILSLTIIPSGIVFGSLTQSGQFLAIGTFSSAPTVRDLTNSVKWLTSQPNKYPVTNYSSSATGTGTQNGGVVTAYEASVGNVGATITAEATDSNGSLATATAGVGCPFVLPNPGSPATPTTPAVPPTAGSCYQNVPQLLSTLTVYNEGLNPNTPELGGNWLVTALSAVPPAPGTTPPPVLHCGPGSPGAGLGSSVCTATYPLGTTVTLTAPARTGVFFGGWSSNCTNTGTITQTGPNTCTVNLSDSDATVGAIFN
jgi:hypothetical protein